MAVKYSRQLAGGLHCMTNDYSRADEHHIQHVLENDRKDLSEK